MYNLDRIGNIKRQSNKDIIVNPIQTGGRLTEAAKAALSDFGDGYSVCDFCEGVLDEIKNPNINEFLTAVMPSFLGCDRVTMTHGAREAIFAILFTMCKPGDKVVVDEHRHYTTKLAAEICGLEQIVIESSGYPDFRIDTADYEAAITENKPRIVLLTYPDGEYGNTADAKKLGEIASRHNVPYVLNGAYSVGRFPVNMREIGADFIVASGHKSMASSGPIGLLGMKSDYEGIVLRRSEQLPNKVLSLLGCTARGLPAATLIASFPEVLKRTSNWEEELGKARYFADELEKYGEGRIRLLGDRPHNHDLMKFETPLFKEIGERHKLKREFLYKGLRKRSITGIKHGITKQMKISTYGLSYEQVDYVLECIKEIAST